MAFDFSLVTSPFRMQPGLRRVADDAPQLTPNLLGNRHLREKMAVLASFAEEALVAVPGFDEMPALRAIAAESARLAPAAFRLEEFPASPARWRAPLLGWSVDARGSREDADGCLPSDSDRAIGDLLRALPPQLRSTALLCLAFEEDFAVIDGASATIPWLAVCLPSRWAPASKVGRHFAEVHGPVADNALLVAAGESLARLVTGKERWERFVWTLTPEPQLHQHPARGEMSWPPEDDEAVADRAVFRSERQTFIPVPGGQQAVFTIHVDAVPLCDAVTRADSALRLHASLASMTPAVLAYRGLAPVRDPLLRWLAQQAAKAAPAAP